MFRHGFFTLLVVVAVGGSVSGQPPLADTVQKYLATANSFPFYRCTFTRTAGKAVVDQKTYKITWKESGSTKCRFAVDGEYEAFEQDGTPQPDYSKVKLAKGPDGKPTLGFIPVLGYLPEKSVRGPDSHGQWNEALMGMGLRDRKNDPNEANVFTPLDYMFGHRRRHGPDWLMAQKGTYTLTDLGEKETDGRRCVGHQFDHTSQPYQITLWFDPAQGMTPVREDTTHKGHASTRTVVTAIRALPDGRWFPERMVWFNLDEANKAPGFVREYVLDTLDVTNRPTADDLTIRLPAGTRVGTEGLKTEFTLRQDEKVSPSDLPELFEKAAQATAAKKAGEPMDTALEHKGRGPSVWFWVLGGVGLLLVVYGGYRWLRYRRATRPAPPSP